MDQKQAEVANGQKLQGNTRACNYAVTIYDYGRDAKQFTEDLKNDDTMRYFIFSEEKCPKTGRLHLQGYIQFKNRTYFNKVQEKLPHGSHIEAARGAPEQNETYCSKEKSHISGPYEFGEVCHQGKRNDLILFKKKVMAGATEKQLCNDDETFVVWALHPLLAKRIKIAQIEPRDRNNPPEVNVVLGPTGVGKTRRVHDRADANGWRVYTKDGSKWWDGYYGQQIILFNDTDVREYWSIENLLNLTDRYQYQGQCKGGYVEINSPIIYWTHNLQFETLYPNADESQLQSLERRITNKVNL